MSKTATGEVEQISFDLSLLQPMTFTVVAEDDGMGDDDMDDEEEGEDEDGEEVDGFEDEDEDDEDEDDAE